MKRWKKVYCLSWRPPYGYIGLPPNAEYISVDFLALPDEIVAVLKAKKVTADHVFFFSYVHPILNHNRNPWTTAQESLNINCTLFSNFLTAIPIASITPERILLQTGARTYGVHLGPTKLPQEESDARVLLEPSFYYAQEDALSAFCEEMGCASNVCVPGHITGAVADAAMKYAYPLAIYAALCAKLGEPMMFPGDVTAWQSPQSLSCALMNAYMEDWAVLPAPRSERFNTCDGSSFTWEAAWPVVSKWYGARSIGPWEGDQYQVQETRFNPRGYGGNGVMRWKFTMRHRLKAFPADGDVTRVFGFLDGTLVRTGAIMLSMDKSRKMGWHGFVDSKDALLETFRDLAKLRMVPPVFGE